MAKHIEIPYKGKTYILEFSRKTASMMERQGFNVNELTDKPATMIPMLFNGAFLMHHERVKNETKDAIFSGTKNRSKLIEALAEMYYAAYSTLFDDEDEDGDEGNPGWAVAE